MTDLNTQAMVTQAMREAILENLRGRRLLKWLFKEDADTNPVAIGYVDGPIDTDTQNEIATTLAGLVLACLPSPAAPEPDGEVVERVATIVENALARHGVPLADMEGTLDDAADILRALTPPPPSSATPVEGMVERVAEALAITDGHHFTSYKDMAETAVAIVSATIRQEAMEAMQEAKLQLEYLDEKHPTGTTPPVIARLEAALRNANTGEAGNVG